MAYQVSTKPDGEKRWWSDHEIIPGDHIAIRPATAAETIVMDKIARGDGTPSLALGKRIREMLAAS